MADRMSMTVDDGTVRTLIAQLRAYHGREAASGQNDGSNDADDMHDGLEMHEGSTDVAGMQGLYGQLNQQERYDLAALCLLGMDEVSSFEEGVEKAKADGQPGLDQMLEMPASPGFLGDGLEKAGYPSGGHDPSRLPSDDEHAFSR